MEWSLVSWTEFRSLARYRQFIVAMMAAYAAGMTVLTLVFAASGRPIAIGTLLLAVAVWFASLVFVPSKLLEFESG